MGSLKDYPIIVLAYLGDAVWELHVRENFIEKGFSPQKTNKLVKSFVNAKFQSAFLDKILDNLNEEEKKIVRRGKNSNIKTFPKSCTEEEYRKATSFEVLIGVWYKSKEYDKIKELIKKLQEEF
ncbi:MAG: Mini-ribonuclease 3 [Fusobacteriaceae bacterium]